MTTPCVCMHGWAGTLKQSSSLTALGRALTSLTKALVPSSMTSVLMFVHRVWRHTCGMPEVMMQRNNSTSNGLSLTSGASNIGGTRV